MAKLNEKQLTFEGVMRIVQGNKWIQLKDIERLEKFIQNQQATIQSLKEDNEQLKKEYKIAIDEMLTDYKKLEKENEQLRKELDNFRPVMFQDKRKGTVILYSKKFGNNDEVSDEKDAIIQRLALENENLRKQVKSIDMVLEDVLE